MANEMRLTSSLQELRFLIIMEEEIAKNNMSTTGSKFTDKIWNHICTRMNRECGYPYTVDHLKVKAKVLKYRYQEFARFLALDGVHWDMKTNVLYASESALKAYRKEHPWGYYDNNVRGERNFDIMRSVFERGVQF